MITIYIRGTKADAHNLSERLVMPLLTVDEYEPAPGYSMVKARVFQHYMPKIMTDHMKPMSSPAPVGTIIYYVSDTAVEAVVEDILRDSYSKSA